ncbi:MAG: vitamin B12-dependent ribonucleotide reductase [Candidatus Cloacimonadota bacterium]|nr:vitamin B12-dependent ribonucleotide reductase [Candidatus Cloacimonadota bacterium]
MKVTDNALAVLKKRYFQKDENGNCIEDAQGMLTRVSTNIAGKNKAKAKKYFDVMDNRYFLPNSPTLMNAGNDLQQLSACFVLPIEDSMENIFESVKNAALIHKSGGGTGFSFSKLRERNALVRSTSGVSSGPITFMKVFNSATDAVKQGGTRRGANMAILNVDHPDILEFITAKEDDKELTNFNISVGITKKFMDAVEADEEYQLISPHSGEVSKSLKAAEVFDLIVSMAYKNGEPGIVFLDRLNEYNPTPEIGKIEATNPCGEQPLLPNEACNLGSINLALMVNDKIVNWDLLKQTVYTATEFLDDVIDHSKFPLPQIDEQSKANRKIGLGIMGWSDMLVQMEIPYDSEEGLELAKEVMEFIDFHSKYKSLQIAKKKEPFQNFQGSTYHTGEFRRESTKLDWDSLLKDIQKYGIRNSTTTTIAPTGTISMIADTSSGVEPNFSLVYVKKVMDDDKLLYVNKYFEEIARKTGFYSKELMEDVSGKGSLISIKEIPKEVKKVFVTSHDIKPEWHIRMQAAFQQYVDNAVSKTINFSNSATKEDINIAYKLAYQLGCKGVTVYRDGSRSEQVLNVGKKVREQEKTRVAPRKRSETTLGVTKKMNTGCGYLYVTINVDETGICEVFAQIGKVGGCASAQLEAIARLISLALRSNVKVESIIKQLRFIRCPNPTWRKGKKILSCADAVAIALEEFIAQNGHGIKQILSITLDEKNENEKPKTRIQSLKGQQALCPECGAKVEYKEGCRTCPVCGWSKCS